MPCGTVQRPLVLLSSASGRGLAIGALEHCQRADVCVSAGGYVPELSVGLS